MIRRRCVFLTLADVLDFVIDDEEAYAPLARLGVDVEAVPWDADVDWSAYDLAVIRSTWDYFHRPREFLETLARIDASTRLYNDLETVRWNVEKTYLLDLAARGVPIVPTLVREHFAPGDLDGLFSALDTEELIVKPAISAAALDTFRLRPGDDDSALAEKFDHRTFLAQPFVQDVLSAGELSLMYIDGAFSHAVRKTPKPGDFRSQEEHGSEVVLVTPEPALLAAADAALAALDRPPLYARADLVRTGGACLLMELELVEPALYLRMDAAAPERLARAIGTLAQKL